MKGKYEGYKLWMPWRWIPVIIYAGVVILGAVAFQAQGRLGAH